MVWVPYSDFVQKIKKILRPTGDKQAKNVANIVEPALGVVSTCRCRLFWSNGCWNLAPY